MHRLSLALALTLAPGLTSPIAAQDAPADGFAVSPLAVGPPTNPGGPYGLTVFGAARTLSNGDVVRFDGQTVERVTAGGAPVATLGTLPAVSFTGCLAVDPAETIAIVGESSTGVVYRVALDGSGMTPLITLPYNFDAVFDGPASVLISANVTQTFADNHIVRVDTTTGASSDVCFVGSPSGPVALDPAGNLYYGLQTTPTRSVIVWTSAQLQSGVLLNEGDAITLGTGFEGIGSIAVDGVGGGVYVANNDYFAGTNRIQLVEGNATTSPVIVEGETPFNNLGSLEIVASDCGGLLAPWQPACGGALRYSAVDFVSVAYRAEVVPARPTSSFTGPGAGAGPGAVTFGISGGPAFGTALIFFGATADFAAPEVAHAFAGVPPIFSGFPLGAITLLGSPVLLDADGAAGLRSYDPGLDGLITVQALCLDSGGMVRGTSTAAGL